MNKRILIAVILTFVANILCIPLWTECDYIGFVRTLFDKEARLDLLYFGKIVRSEPFQFLTSLQPLNASASLKEGENARRTDLSFRARGEWEKLLLQLEPLQDGEIAIVLKGPEVRDEYGYCYSVLTDWRNLKINGEVIFDRTKTVSFRNVFVKKLRVKKGESIPMEVEFRRHHFSTCDFVGLKSGRTLYLITGSILFFFLIYRLLDLLAIRGGGTNTGDVFLSVVFFLCCLIPMSSVSKGVRNVRENRVLDVKPELKEILKEKSDYGKRYEGWFNDHFCGRAALIKLHDVIRNKLSHIIRAKRGIYFKKNGWDFLMPLVPPFDCDPAFAQAIVNNLNQLNLFCQQHKIKLYVFEVPKKEAVYKELIREEYGFDENEFVKISQAQEAVRNEARKCHIPYVFPYEALRDAKKQHYVFFKLKHHWTDWGAFVGYRELMKEVCKDEYVERYEVGHHLFQIFNFGDVSDRSNWPFYNYYDHKDGSKMMLQVGKFTKDFTYPGGKYKIMLLGTSQNENLSQFLPYSAAQTKYIRLNRGQVKVADEYKILKLYKKDILAFKPDILILSISTENLRRLRALCSIK